MCKSIAARSNKEIAARKKEYKEKWFYEECRKGKKELIEIIEIAKKREMSRDRCIV